MPTTSQQATADVQRNEVTLVGEIRRDPLERVLPSGDAVVAFSVRVPRAPTRVAGPRGTGDSIEIAAWTAVLRRRALGFQVGDLVEVHGALRRQVRSPSGVPISRYEVEAQSLRRLARASA